LHAAELAMTKVRTTHRHEMHFDKKRLLARFWRSGSGFWRGRNGWSARLLTVFLLGIVVAQLITQYWLNYWNRDFFNAIEQRDVPALGQLTLTFFALAALSTALAIVSVWGRMTTQRKWRNFLTIHLIGAWLARGHYRSLSDLNGTDNPRNPEYRIAEDARVATDAPVDLVLSLFSSVLTVLMFFQILASVGGDLTIHAFEMAITIPAYLAIAVIAYSGLVTAAMLFIGRRLTSVIQDQIQAEATFRAAANLIRESGEGLIINESEREERSALWTGLRNVIVQWQRLCGQLMRTTFVTHGNSLLAPVIGLILCLPTYLAGSMSLGEVTQAAAAFLTVQGAFNWFVDNFQRMADWRSSANRVAALLLALDELEPEPSHPAFVSPDAATRSAPRT
jgi:ABC-type uncharacterized transport system fused permease/ATPase subunit